MKQFAAPYRLLAVALLGLALVGSGVALGAEEKPATTEKKTEKKKTEAPVVVTGNPPLCPTPAPPRAAVNTLEDMFGGSSISWLVIANASIEKKDQKPKTRSEKQ